MGIVVFWTDERKAELKRLFLDEKKSASQVGLVFGKSGNAIIGAAHRMGIKKGKPVQPQQSPKPAYKRARTAAERVERRKTPPKPTLVKGEDIPPLLDTILDLNSATCSYPYGIQQFKFCGRPRTRGAFCTQHADICYNNPLYGRVS